MPEEDPLGENVTNSDLMDQLKIINSKLDEILKDASKVTERGSFGSIDTGETK